MKKLLIFLLPMALLASCSEYDTSIHGVDSHTQCAFRPLDQAIRDSAAKGWVSIDSSHAGNPLVCRVDVKVWASWRQKWAIARHNGSEGPAIAIWFIGFLCICFSFYQGVWGKQTALLVVGPAVLGIALGWLGAAQVDWSFTKEAMIPKWLYDQLMASDGNLAKFWAENLFK
jgi:hypothetical protein